MTNKSGCPISILQVLAAVIKAGASREHEILAEIRDAVFSFIRKMEPKRVMDTMLVSRVRILYIRSLLARSPELQSIKVMKFQILPLPLKHFLPFPVFTECSLYLFFWYVGFSCGVLSRKGQYWTQ